MTFEFKPAARENTFTLTALAGASGSGKTYSALRMARGMSPQERIAFIDTEARRALHYAPTQEELRTGKIPPDKFKFMHSDMRPPFRPIHFIEGIQAAEKSGAEVCIIDSASHEYDGEGGIFDWANEIEEGTPKPGIENPRDPRSSEGWKDWAVKPVPSPANWKVPKLAHKEMMNALLQARCHIIFCLRAEEKILIKKEGGKTVVEPAGWIPICEKRFMFEMTVSFTLTPGVRRGVPNYDLPHKIEDHHRAIFPDTRHIGEDSGAQLAAWAAGADSSPSTKIEKSPIDIYGVEVAAHLKDDSATQLAEWWSETRQRREDLQIPADRLEKMDRAVAARLNSNEEN